MAEMESASAKAPAQGGQRAFPLQRTAAMLNQRLGLYLSAEQEKGLATGLLIGAVLGGAILAWTISEAVRDR